ncbi:MAG: hypothetical protein HGJ94_22210 [Desulfosarcina sp.]|nr:hypothetical protein [Desulfosarcina sp.]MBC2742363.1 hypothetical protein [Desulfosarcina sp.]MBC2765274.1 hypothetical protein [Desulfosarcina sp.]
MKQELEPRIAEILKKALDIVPVNREEALTLMRVPLHTKECYALMEAANRLSRSQFGNKGENHYHIGLNVEPCPMDCLFCSLTRKAGIFKEKIEFSMDQIVAWTRKAEEHGTDGLNLMITGTYPF